MYNGIGLNTPRGSGTSGHVVRNASALRPRQTEGIAQKPSPFASDRSQKTKPVDQGIIEHERKRLIEIKCLELQDELEEEGLSEDDIASRVDELRLELLRNVQSVDISKGGKIRSFETQKLAEAKHRENQQMAKALRISSEHVEGEAFDQELQELKRQKMLLQRELDREKRSRKARDSATSSSEEEESESSCSEEGRHYSRHRHRVRGTRVSKRRSRSPRNSAESSSESSSEKSAHSRIGDDKSRKRAGKKGQSRRSRPRSRHRHQRSSRSDSSEPDDNGGARDRSSDKGDEERTASPVRKARLVENGEPGEIEDSE